ncbi:uncharacterized protein LOC127246640 isoform X2 [Andrographis paniculata]|nr:uncharacterized protein LOC127246640 isoform X2 [Andrographis paniculata]
MDLSTECIHTVKSLGSTQLTNSGKTKRQLNASITIAMADHQSRSHSHSHSHSQDLLHILGFGSITRACKSFLFKCYPNKKSKKTAINVNPKSTSDDKVKKKKKNDNSSRDRKKDDPPPASPTAALRRRSCDDYTLRSSQWSPATSGLTRSKTGRRSVDAATMKQYLSRTKTTSSCILYSNSHGLIKPPAIEHYLHCTLDDLCFGCVKKIQTTRDAVSDNGRNVEEEEELTIKVKPGWRKDTRITFNGRDAGGVGVATADVVFVVVETKHPLFSRRDDNLLLEIELPLIDALTGCTLSVPLLGGETISLQMDEIVYPGYEKIVAGQGMPKHNDPESRGDLVISFRVKFPEELTEQQRIDAADILQQAR